MAAPQSHKKLRPFLDRLAARYHHPAYLGSDPLAMVHGFSDPKDQEVAALFAALLAYGNVKQINASLRSLFDRMGNSPYEFLRGFDFEAASVNLHGFKHRFSDSEDVLCLCWLLHQALKHGNLESGFAQGYCSDEPDLVLASSRWVDYLHGFSFAPHFNREKMLSKSSFKHLMPRTDRGSACKRIHLFLRWMIRPSDGIDLGLWQSIAPDKLLMPVDTHIFRIGHNLGLLKLRSGSLAAARQITEALRQANPGDPVGYDFALCRLGILKSCPTSSNLEACRPCDLHDVCMLRKSLEKKRPRKQL